MDFLRSGDKISQINYGGLNYKIFKNGGQNVLIKKKLEYLKSHIFKK